MKNKNAQNWELGKNNAYKRDFWGVKNPDFWGTKKKKKSPHIIWEQATTWGDTVNPNLIWGAKQNKQTKKQTKQAWDEVAMMKEVDKKNKQTKKMCFCQNMNLEVAFDNKQHMKQKQQKTTTTTKKDQTCGLFNKRG